MTPDKEQILTGQKTAAASRKDAHIDLALDQATKSAGNNGFDRLRFEHCALPEIALSEIDLSVEFLGRPLAAPMMIGAMTGGTMRAEKINRALAAVAQDHKIAVGSQRAALELGKTASDLRIIAPDIPIIGNLGGIQLAQSGGIDLAKAAIDDLQADAIAIHLNPLQEAVQPEGEHDWRGVRDAIAALVKADMAPVIIKEVGAGISASLANDFFACGVAAVDVAGFGGTNWARIEAARRDDDITPFAPFLDWGIPTLDGLMAVTKSLPKTLRHEHLIIASGGLRHGLDAMRAYWLGADMTSLAGPMLKGLLDDDKIPSPEQLGQFATQLKQQMALTLFLTGAQNLAEFRRKPAWLDGQAL
jgi:isopentenyl-diphosphate delta-isomerase